MLRPVLVVDTGARQLLMMGALNPSVIDNSQVVPLFRCDTGDPLSFDAFGRVCDAIKYLLNIVWRKHFFTTAFYCCTLCFVP